MNTSDHHFPPGGNGASFIWQFGHCRLDERSRKLYVGDDRELTLEPKPFALLVFLLRQGGEVVTHAEIHDAIWPRRVVGPETIKNAISKIRIAIRDAESPVIETLARVGYRVAVPVVKSEAPTIRSPSVKSLTIGHDVPNKPGWKLIDLVDQSASSPLWLGQDEGSGEIHRFHFSSDEGGLGLFKRQVLTDEKICESADAARHSVKVLGWQFERPPYYIESEHGYEDLEAWCRRFEIKTSLEDRIALACAIADAVAAMHLTGVLHRDLRPKNIRVCRASHGVTIKLDGFANSDRSLRSANAIIYSAPELLAGEPATVLSDIYALGVLSFQIFISDFGKPLASGWEMEIADEDLRTDLFSATHWNPNMRMPAARLLADGLRALPERRIAAAALRQNEHRAQIAHHKLERARARRPWKIAAVGAMGIGACASAIFYAGQRAESDRNRAISEFLIEDFLEPNDANIGSDPGVSLHDVLLLSLGRVEQRFKDDPIMEARFLNYWAASLDALNDHQNALNTFGKIIELEGKTDGAKSRRVYTDRLAEVVELADLKRSQEARAKLVPLLNEIGDEKDRTYLMALCAQGELAFAEGRFPDEAKYWRSALEMAEANSVKFRLRPLSIDSYRGRLMDALMASRDFSAAIQEGRLWRPILVERYGIASGQVRKLDAQLQVAASAEESGN